MQNTTRSLLSTARLLTNATSGATHELSQFRFYATHHNADLVVIGSGPGGYFGAIKAAQLGLIIFGPKMQRHFFRNLIGFESEGSKMYLQMKILISKKISHYNFSLGAKFLPLSSFIGQKLSGTDRWSNLYAV